MAASGTSIHRLRTGDPVLIVANGNPLSRRADSMAQAALRQLKSSFEGQVELVTTDYAGHARVVAETWASERLDGTIIGIGGDGTLNEIANGILSATVAFGSRVVLVVCGGGNANDQYRSWPPSQRIRPESVLSAEPVSVDVLEVSYGADNHKKPSNSTHCHMQRSVLWPRGHLQSTVAAGGCLPISPSSPRRCCERGQYPW